MTAHVISSGITTGYSLMTGDTLTVSLGGVSDNSDVGAGAHEYVLAGGLSEFDQIASGGTLVLSSGATVSDVVISSGGIAVGGGVFVGDSYDYGLVSSALVAGTLYVEGDTRYVSVEAQGQLEIQAGASSLADKILAGGAEFVSSGGLAYEVSVSSGGLEYLYSGAIASGVTISSGGTVDMTAVFSSGVYTAQANPVAATSLGGVTFKAGANLNLFGATVMSGATLSVASGANVSNATVSSGGHLDGPGQLGGYNNFLYGEVSGVTLNNANLYVEAGGIASGVAVGLDGYMVVDAGGHANGTTVNGTFADLVISAGGIGSGTLVEDAGGYGEAEIVYGSALATTILSGGTEDVYSGGYVSGATVSNGGSQHVYSGGVVSGVHILSGGVELLDAGASATGVVVSSGGEAEFAVTVSSGASLVVRPNPVLSNTVMSGVMVDVGGVLSFTSATIAGKGLLSLTTGASVQDVTVLAGGQVNGPGTISQYGDDFGLISGIQIGDLKGDEGYFTVEAGGITSNVTIVQGQLTVLSGGKSILTVLDGAGTSDTIYGFAEDTTVRSGAEEMIQSGGSTRTTRVSAGGEQVVQSGGVASGTVVYSGGLEVLSSGAVAVAVTVESGGAASLYAVISSGVSFTLPASPIGGTSATLDGVTVQVGAALNVVGATILSGGALTLAAGAVTGDVTIEAGGRLSGPGELQGANTDFGLVSGATLGDIEDSGSLLVGSGGTADGVAVVNGSIEVASGGLASGTLFQGAGASLLVDFGASASATALRGAGASDDVFGSAVATTVASGAEEVVESGGAATGAHVSSGGEQLVSAGGVASTTVVSAGGVEVLASGAETGAVQILSGGEVELAGIVTAGMSFVLSASPLAAKTSLLTLGQGVTVAVGGRVDLYSATVMSKAVLTLAAGAVASGVTVSAGGSLRGPGTLGGGFYDASSDFGVVSGVQVGDGAALDFGGDAELQVGAGGVAAAITVTSGLLSVLSGGVAETPVVLAGGELIVSSGGTATKARMSAGGREIVYSGAIVTGNVVLSGGTLELDGGTIAGGATALAERVGATVTSSGVEVAAGGTIDYGDVSVLSGGALRLGAGGSAETVMIAAGATVSGAGDLGGEDIDQGLVSGVILDGRLDVSGKVYGGQVGSGAIAGEIEVDAGGVASAVSLVDGSLSVSSNGLAEITRVSSGAEVTVEAGGRAVESLVSSGGVQTVDSGGVDSSTRIYSGATEVLEAGAVATAITVYSGGAVDIGLVVSAGKAYTLPTAGAAGALSGVSIQAGGVLDVTGASVQSGAILSLGKGSVIAGVLSVSAGGIVSGAGELGGAGQYDDIYGLISGVTIGDATSNYAAPVIYGGGAADNVILTAGALFIESGGVASGVLVDGEFAEVYIVQGGVASGVTLGAGGASFTTEDVLGSAVGTIVSSGGVLDVYGNVRAVATDATVLSGGLEGAAVGGTINGSVVMSGGIFDVNPGAIITNVSLSSGAGLEIYSSNYVLASGAVLHAGAVTSATSISGVSLLSGAVVEYDSVTVTSGATMIFTAGGPAYGLTVDAGGIVSGSADLIGVTEDFGALVDPTIGIASGSLFAAFGYLMVNSGGVVTSATLTAEGTIFVTSGAIANGTIVGSSGVQMVSAGAVASGAQVMGGGLEYVASGAVVSGTIVSSGGFFDLAGGVVGGKAVLIDSGQVSATTSVAGARLLSGASLDYASYTVSSGGLLSVTATGATDGAVVRAGGVLSGAGALVGYTQDYGLVAGVQIGTPGGGESQLNRVDLGPVTQVYDGSLTGEGGSVEVESGGVLSAATVEDTGFVSVLSGGVARHEIVSGFLNISSGGTDSGSTILSGGEIELYGGATAVGTTVDSGAHVYFVPLVSSGQIFTIPGSAVASQTVVDGLILQSGAYLEADDATVLNGGVLSLASGAVVDSVVVSSGGFLTGQGALSGYVYFTASAADYGVVSGVTVSSYASLEVAGGAAAGDVTLASGSMTVESGGYASGVLVEGGGALTVQTGATISGAVLGGGAEGAGSETVYGVSDSDAIYAGGVQTVSYDAVASGAVVYSGGEQDDDGTVSGTRVLSGGILSLGYGVDAVGAAVASGGILKVGGFGSLQDATLVDGQVTAATSIDGVAVSVGGVIDYDDVTLYGGASLTIAAGAVSTDVTNYEGVVSGAGTLGGIDYNGAVIDGVVVEGTLFTSGTLSGVTLASGAQLYASTNGTDSGTIINNGGMEVVEGATVVGTIVSSGGVQNVYSGTVKGTVVLSGGTEEIQAYTGVVGATVSSGGTVTLGVIVSAGQSFTAPAEPTTATTTFGGITLDAGATLMLQSAQVQSGGVLNLVAGAQALDVIVDSGGVLSGAGSVAGLFEALSGATVSAIHVAGGVDYFYGGATESGVVVASGATVLILNAVVSGGTTLSDGVFTAPTVVSGITLMSGAQLTAQNDVVASGGALSLLSTGSAFDDTTLAGAKFTDNGSAYYDGAGAQALLGTLTGGGMLVEQGGGDLVLSASASGFSGQAVIGAGTVELAVAGALGEGSAVFRQELNSQETLQIDSADTPANKGTFVNAINGFSSTYNAIDLRGVAFSSGAAATLTGGVLTLVDGAETLHFTLQGLAASAFQVSEDAAGGSIITPTAAGAAALVQATAGFFHGAPSPGAITTPSSPSGSMGAPYSFLTTTVPGRG